VEGELLLGRSERQPQMTVARVAAHRLVEPPQRLLEPPALAQPLGLLIEIDELLLEHETLPARPDAGVAVAAARDHLGGNPRGPAFERRFPALPPVGPQRGAPPGQDRDLDDGAEAWRGRAADERRAHLVGVGRPDDPQRAAEQRERSLGVRVGGLEQLDEVGRGRYARRGRRGEEPQLGERLAEMDVEARDRARRLAAVGAGARVLDPEHLNRSREVLKPAVAPRAQARQHGDRGQHRRRDQHGARLRGTLRPGPRVPRRPRQREDRDAGEGRDTESGQAQRRAPARANDHDLVDRSLRHHP
jgi:hypothetical protein